jgi:hypothetical protein
MHGISLLVSVASESSNIFSGGKNKKMIVNKPGSRFSPGIEFFTWISHPLSLGNFLVGYMPLSLCCFVIAA